jgi:hypothetical protein
MPTPYAPSQGGFGYSDARIEENRFRVVFRGNALTPRETVELYLLHRAAEVTLENGYDWFRIVRPVAEEGAAPVPRKRGGKARATAPRNYGYRRVPRGRPSRPRYRPYHPYRPRYHGSVRYYSAFPFWYDPWPFGPYVYYPYRHYWHGPYYYGPYPMRELPVAAAEILAFRGEKPEDDPRAYDARDVIARLGPRIRRPAE